MRTLRSQIPCALARGAEAREYNDLLEIEEVGTITVAEARFSEKRDLGSIRIGVFWIRGSR